MTFSIVCAQTGIDNARDFENSASHIASWLKALKDGKKLVVSAGVQVHKAPTHLRAMPPGLSAEVKADLD